MQLHKCSIFNCFGCEIPLPKKHFGCIMLDMSSSRDSSVWRSLAVAFGDGLAFGVGMKLTQTTAGKAAPATSLPVGFRDRLALLEERLTRVERTPVALPPPGSASGKLDQQVFDALVNAVETRLQEQAAATERRMADLEARLAVELRSVLEEVHAVAAGAETLIRETRAASQEGIDTARREVAELAAGRRNDAAAIASGLEKLGLRIVALERNASVASETAGQYTAAMSAKVDQVGRTLLEGYEALRGQVVDFDRKSAVTEARFTAALTAHSDELAAAITAGEERLRAEFSGIEGRIDAVAGLVSSHEHKPAAETIAAEAELRAEVADLRGQLDSVRTGAENAVAAAVQSGIEGAERRLLEQAREASEQAEGTIARTAETAVRQKIAPLAAAVAELQAKSDQTEAHALAALQSIGQAYMDAARRSAPRVDAPSSEPAPAPAAEEPLPAPKPAGEATGMEPAPIFTEARKSGRVWRVPLVSSFVIGAASLALLQFVR
jgi:hypothetical protein